MKHTQAAWQTWLGHFSDPRTQLRIDNAVHDHLPPNWHHNGLLIDAHINWLLLSGGVQGQIDGARVTVPSGGWLCLAPRTPIHFQCQDPTRPLHMLRFRLHLARDGQQQPVPGGGFIIEDAAAIRPLAAQLLSCADATDALADQRRRGLALAAYAEAARLLLRPRSGVRGLNEAQLRRVDDVIASHLPHAVPPAVLADAAGLKADTFARAFKRSRGKSPRQWIAERRIQHAAELLLTPGATASAVAEDCGYADLFHFSRQFKQVMGLGPRAWRQQHGLQRSHV